MTRNIHDENLKNVTGGALGIAQRRAWAAARHRAKEAPPSEGGQLPGGPGEEFDDAADQAPARGPVDLGRR